MICRLVLRVLCSVEFTVTDGSHGGGNKVELVNVKVKKLLISRRAQVIQWNPAVCTSALEDVHTGSKVQKQGEKESQREYLLRVVYDSGGVRETLHQEQCINSAGTQNFGKLCDSEQS